MTTITDEARKKLKAIMSAKLVELVGHCESELPDYVVSMIANNKSKDYMKKNLEVFIGDHSEEFSEWLAELKEKINRPEKSDAAQPQSPSPVVIPESSKTTAKPEKKSEKTEKKEEKKVDKSKEEDHSRKRKRIEYDIKPEESRKSRSDRRDKREERKRSASRDRHSRKNSRREDSPARRRRARSKTWSDDEMGDPVPAEKKVASSIVVPRAVHDGPKTVSSSVTVKRKIVTDTDKSAKSRSNIFFKAMNDASRADGAQTKNDKNKVTVEVDNDSEMDDDERVVSTQKKGSKKEGSPTVRVRLDIPSAPLANADGQKAAQKRKIVWDLEEDTNNKKETRSRPVLKRTFSPSSSKKKTFEDQENEAAIDAFIAATNLEMAISKDSGDDEDIAMSDSDEPHMKRHRKMVAYGEEGADSMETGYVKPKPRCNFWPGCTKGDACEFVHPSVPCTKFPRCAFGKQCIYIHPPCKFGFNCRNPNCPAVHGDAAAIELVNKLLGIQAQPPVPTTFQSQNMTLKRTTAPVAAALETPTSEIPCRFRNMCKNPNCAYKHPAICRFGSNCYSPVCAFRHVETQPPKPTLPAADKYKWKAAA